MGRLIDLIGQKFGKLTVIARAENDKRRHSRWLCKCDCGGITTVRGSHLTNSLIKSCGCLKKENLLNGIAVTHGYTKDGKTPKIYQTWLDINKRCDNKNNKNYKDYGGRKIKVCQRWSNKNPKGFENFLKDMGEPPTQKHQN